ncbi:MAG: TonB family protein [Alphaproteobacteria bacterium]|nr:TonB family protein [Alphaproteobacteria bacterium]MBU6474179.1 TonB family protein [Alphaproteobacteria bacterium]MDE2013662.1 TonB family protein [Alphaproteobacteria bacterium]MDE2072714.1 TonB family protein [Alphaproteobacteria bacterium]MDE2351472.1 TonB family protein [Alphaproteobacteria bacterium]
MQQPEHLLKSTHAGIASPRRYISIGLVGLIHVVVIWALATGLAQSVFNKMPEIIKAEVVQQKPPEQEKTPPPPPPDTVKPPPPFVPPPDINIQTTTTETNAISDVQSHKAAPQVPATYPTPRGRSHSCEAGYPPISRRLGETGVVLVRFTVNVDGSVTNVSVAKSSGYSRLDEAAVSCASRWEYNPATRGGKPLAITYEAKVLYQLNE